jgi:hypothetical protein
VARALARSQARANRADRALVAALETRTRRCGSLDLALLLDLPFEHVIGFERAIEREPWSC